MCALAKQSPFVTFNLYTRPRDCFLRPRRYHTPLAASAAICELSSVLDPCAHGQETARTCCADFFYNFGLGSNPLPSRTSRILDPSVTEEKGFCRNSKAFESVAVDQGIVRIS